MPRSALNAGKDNLFGGTTVDEVDQAAKIDNMPNFVTFLLLLLPAAPLPPSPTRVLFLGNSYTYSNDMPAILQALAAAAGDSLDYEMETPDGASLEEHYRRGSVAIATREGTWDFVVLQEQSLRPAMPIRQVEKEFFRYGELLGRQIKDLHPGAKTILYVTWGRWHHTGALCEIVPEACTYWGADSLITLRYRMLAGRMGAKLAQAGPAWRYVQQHHPEIELFNPDAIHPSLEGSYLAACCLYAAIFDKDPERLAYDYVLAPKVAALLRKAASVVAREK